MAEVQHLPQQHHEAAAAPAAPVSLGTLQAASPGALMQEATSVADQLAHMVTEQRLSVAIQGRPYVKVEGWTTLAALMGVVAREVETTEEAGVFTAVVELVRLADGAVISRASAECGEEKPWNGRPRYARRSMAQTRATGKACRLAFSWVMALAGYEATPAEEMDHGQAEGAREEAAPEIITEAQHQALEARIRELGLDRERVRSWIQRAWGVEHLNEVPAQRFDELRRRLQHWAQKQAAEQAQQD